jgi:putative spermidine/putrescine transport system permease protein
MNGLRAWVQVSPLALVLLLFFAAPIAVVVVASFLPGDGYGGMQAGFTLENYAAVLGNTLTLKLYASTLKFAVVTWALTLAIGFWVAYFLVFHVRSRLLAIGLFLVCTVPFWTSNIIRMISWIPLLGQNGLVNQALISVHAIEQPLGFLLFSDFAVIAAYVHQLTIFMIVPIFNAMSRIDRRTLEAGHDAGASRWDAMRLVVIPLSKNGIALGSIFVLAIVMGDFFVVKVMSGGGSASVVSALYEDIAVLQYPPAAASAVLLLLVVVALVTLIVRTVDVRQEIAR